MAEHSALILVDLQNDFCEGGNFTVPLASQVLPIVNQLQPLFHQVIATKDWHPADHLSFASNHPEGAVGKVVKLGDVDQVLWPDHCVQNSAGAEFHPQLDASQISHTFLKGTDKGIDSYSAFYDNAHMRDTGLATYLREKGIENVYLLGLATDYCVKYSALDAKQLGFNVFVVEDACRGINLAKDDVDAALNEMRDAGIGIIKSDDLLSQEIKPT